MEVVGQVTSPAGKIDDSVTDGTGTPALVARTTSGNGNWLVWTTICRSPDTMRKPSACPGVVPPPFKVKVRLTVVDPPRTVAVTSVGVVTFGTTKVSATPCRFVVTLGSAMFTFPMELKLT